MKKLLLLFFLAVAGLTAQAQDVIVGLDGSKTKSKVLEITQTEIKYKKFDNQEGPTYTMQKNLVQSVLYANGTTEEISQVMLKEIKTKSGKNLKKASWIVGGSIVLAGLIMNAKAVSDFNEGKIDDYDCSTKQGWSIALMGAGVATWGLYYFRGRALEKKAQRYNVTSLTEFTIPVAGGKSLISSVDVFHDSQHSGKSYGLGLKYVF